MTYALVKDGAVVAYPYSFAQLRKDNPQVSFPREPSDERLAEFGVVTITPTDRPDIDRTTQNLAEGTPALVGKVWTQVWNVTDASPEQVAVRRAIKADEDAAAAIKADSFVESFIAMTPAQVASYIDANVTNLASAKTVIAKMAMMLLLLARREFRE